MLRRIALPTVACVVVAVAVSGVGAFATTVTRHKCSFDLTVRFAPVKVLSGTPPFTGKGLYAATSDGTLCGHSIHGAGRSVNTYPTPGKFSSAVKIFTSRGSLSGPASGTGAPQPDGSIKFSGKGTITSGTGIYGRPTGSYKFTGTEPKDSSVATQHAKGTLSYSH